ncbi:MAG: cold shock domain-containing protein [Bacteroidetes bacterium]|nr:cold shock domain-containing protein [Bacteroidota bacterium]
MAKSQETFSKKEAEKKKAQKRKEKEQRKEERKANNAKNGTSLEDMMAYVDENGNITSTPPDPNRKNSIKVEDIVIGARNNVEANPADSLRKGRITFFNESKGYGFIKDLQTQESIFVHINQLTEAVKENDKVTFEVERGPKGFSAVNVKVTK